MLENGKIVKKAGNTYRISYIEENEADYSKFFVELLSGDEVKCSLEISALKDSDTEEFISSVTNMCDVLIENINANDLAPEVSGTEVFSELRREAEDSVKIKDKTTPLEEELPYLIRKRTGEKIFINKNIFKIGKDASYVDYLISDNPTVSRNHADIIKKKDGFYVKDKGSLNHTFIDGHKLTPERSVKIEAGSLLQLADDVFEFWE